MGARWRNLANMIEPSMCGSVAVFLSNYFDDLFNNITVYNQDNAQLA